MMVLACASPSLQAHHSFAAEFDAASKVKLTGTVTNLQWRNPHTYFFVDVTDEKGVVHNWAFELGSPNVLMRRGWTRETLKSGDTVTVEGARARDGSYKANANSVVLGTGKRLFNGTAEEQSQ
jgi:DNA/RNA endonuclease YhcR with UshA esterase domain